jgi:hypothetical protein
MNVFPKSVLFILAAALLLSSAALAQPQPILGNELGKAWEALPQGSSLPVVISLRREIDAVPLPTHVGQTVVSGGQVVSRSVDGVFLTEDEFEASQEELRQTLAAAAEERLERMAWKRQELHRRMGWTLEALGAGNRVYKALRKDDVDSLITKSGDLLSSVTLRLPEHDEVASGLVSVGLTDWAHPFGHDGTGIGVYMREANGKKCPKPAQVEIDAARYTLIGGTPKLTSGHASRAGHIMQQAATEAHLYCSGEYFVANPASYDPPIYVANHSWGASTGFQYAAGYEDDFDDDIYNNRIITFKSVGNGGNVTSPGKAYNIIAVGGYDDVDDSLYNHSYANPETDAEKPEIVAPGVCLDFPSWACRTGTSYSSPFAVGFTAALLENLPQLRNRPELAKAALMAGAIRNIEGDARLSDKDGAGGIDFKTTFDSTVYRWWDGENGDFFDVDDEITFTESLVAGIRYRIAAVWLIPGSYAIANLPDGTTMNLDLDVSFGGSTVTSSTSTTNAFEIVDFVAASTGNHDVTIARVSNSGQGRVILGYNLAPVP